MGSDSDLTVMSAAVKICEELGLAHEVSIVSAHRTPERLVSYAKDAKKRGLKAIIAGAGGAAHLPGMVASLTPLPVIGVPVKTSALDGMDSLLSIVQMPGGVPVATVAINGAKNAGLLAAQLIGAYDDTVSQKVLAYKQNMQEEVEQKVAKLDSLGYASYLDAMEKKG